MNIYAITHKSWRRFKDCNKVFLNLNDGFANKTIYDVLTWQLKCTLPRVFDNWCQFIGRAANIKFDLNQNLKILREAQIVKDIFGKNWRNLPNCCEYVPEVVGSFIEGFWVVPLTKKLRWNELDYQDVIDELYKCCYRSTWSNHPWTWFRQIDSFINWIGISWYHPNAKTVLPWSGKRVETKSSNILSTDVARKYRNVPRTWSKY